jgi:hypothetical protein
MSRKDRVRHDRGKPPPTAALTRGATCPAEPQNVNPNLEKAADNPRPTAPQ